MLDAALDLATRRMPPSDAPETLEGLLRLLPRGQEALGQELCEKLEAEQPLEEANDSETVSTCTVPEPEQTSCRPPALGEIR